LEWKKRQEESTITYATTTSAIGETRDVERFLLFTSPFLGHS
jgi:hypothetical protein